MNAAAPDTPDSSPDPSKAGGEYVVVARRYRPRSFDQLIGQEHVARALSNAISLDRVGHAYLFTGARGVGKTSAARILAKALDCVHGPTPTPCDQCDICQGIAAGSDIDVLEIDGASNRGIDEIRQLRQNAGVRPSRARYKIYIIDEVHMLTREAFNALLKTLEEPPEHVKFIFCTTEVTKIPITILSRCQRFDFAGIRPASIAERLRQIVEAENLAVAPEALAILARRAAGSMRDSQSLLEQLLAFGREGQITADDVNALLGTADDGRLTGMLEHVTAGDARAALAELDAALTAGVDVGQFVEQFLGVLRDTMTAAVGAPADQLMYLSADRHARLVEIGAALGLETILAMMQVVDQTLSRLRYSTQPRLVAEIAVVRLASLERLDEVLRLVGEMRKGGGALPQQAGLPKRPALLDKPAVAHRSVTTPAKEDNSARKVAATTGLSSDNLAAVWQEAMARVSEMLADNAAQHSSLAIVAPNRIAVTFHERYNFRKSFCERPDQLAELERALAEVTGASVKVELLATPDGDEASTASQTAQQPAATTRPVVSSRQRLAEKAAHPLVRRAGELFDAHPTRVDEPKE